MVGSPTFVQREKKSLIYPASLQINGEYTVSHSYYCSEFDSRWVIYIYGFVPN